MREPDASASRDLLFVYGTLRRGFRNPVARRLHRTAEWLGPARAGGGRLVDLGSYPGFVPVADRFSRVAGDLFRLPAEPDLLPLLDRYEGCSAVPGEPSEYRRELRAVRNSGCVRRAWIYVFHGPVAGLPFVPIGDYLAYVRRRAGGA